jgi:hypothetical protein
MKVNKIKKNLKYIIILYRILIFINFYILKTLNIKFTHNKSMGFGDAFLYFFLNYRLIKKEKIKTLNFSDITLKSSEFFFGKKYSLSIIPKLPMRIYYQVMGSFQEDTNPFPFSSIFQYDVKKILECRNLKYSFRRLIICKLLKKKNNSLLKNYICIHIKHYNNNPYDILGSSLRQIYNLEKIEKLLIYLLKKDIQIVILNSEHDTKAYSKLRVMKSKMDKNNMIFFAKDLYPKFSFEDQCNLALNSLGYIGSDGGPSALYLLLKKKTFVFDSFKRRREIAIHKNYKLNYNFFVLYKKIIYNNKKFFLSDRVLNFLIERRVSDFKIEDVKYLEIEKEIEIFFDNI